MGPLQSPPIASSGQTATEDVKYLVASIAGSVERENLPSLRWGAGPALALIVVAVDCRALGVVAAEERQRVGSH